MGCKMNVKDDLLNEGLSFKVRDGHFVNARVQRICQAIHEYEPELQVYFIPESMRKPGQAAYRIIHSPVGHEPYILFTVRRDEDFDERILQRIIANDQRNGKAQLTEYEAWEEAQKRVQQQEWLDKLEEANDIAAHVLRSHKNKYVVDKNIVIRDYGGII